MTMKSRRCLTLDAGQVQPIDEAVADLRAELRDPVNRSP